MANEFILDKVPQRIDEIFEKLSSGNFICSNSVERDNRELHEIIENKLDIITEYFSKIGFKLEKGEGYFYFSKDYKGSDEKKLEKFYDYIDLLDFLKSFNSNFVAGFTFTSADIAQQCSVDLNLKEKLNELRKDKNKSVIDRVRDIIRELRSSGFVEQVNPDEERFKVLSSFSYLENIILTINIEDDIDEIT